MPVVGHDRGHRRHLGGGHEQAAVGAGGEERRVRLLRQLAEAGREQARHDALGGLLAIGADRRLIARGDRARHVDDGDRRLGIGGDGEARAGMLGHVEARPRLRRRRRRDPREVRLDQGFDGGLVEVADGDHRHQVGPVPVAVELLQALGREGADAVGRPDRQAIGVARSLEQHRHLLLQHAGVGAEAEAPLFQDDAALLVDLVGLERDAGGPVLEHEERAIDDAGVVGRDLQLEDGLVEAGVGVDVRAEPHPGRLQERDDVLLREVARAVERHVLDEVGEAALIVVLEHGAGVDDEPQLGPPGRLGVAPDVVAQPVRQRADGDPRIDRDARPSAARSSAAGFIGGRFWAGAGAGACAGRTDGTAAASAAVSHRTRTDRNNFTLR